MEATGDAAAAAMKLMIINFSKYNNKVNLESKHLPPTVQRFEVAGEYKTKIPFQPLNKASK